MGDRRRARGGCFRSACHPGESAPDILERIELGNARAVINDRAVEGQSTSIVAAIASADPLRSGTLLMLGDQPGVTAEDLQRVLAAFDDAPDSIAMASWQGEARSPVVFGGNTTASSCS
ncbi:MAG: NTP transferase domain-containing protein [Thermomicrobiales bacterium]